MEIQAGRLRQKLLSLKPIIPTRPLLPILATAYLGDGIIYATNLELFLALLLPEARGMQPMLLPVASLLQTLAGVRDGELVTIEPPFTFKAGRITMSRPSQFDPADYPPVPTLQGASHFTTNGATFTKGLGRASWYAAADDSRPILHTVNIDFSPEVPRAVAADGFRLGIEPLPGCGKPGPQLVQRAVSGDTYLVRLPDEINEIRLPQPGMFGKVQVDVVTPGGFTGHLVEAIGDVNEGAGLDVKNERVLDPLPEVEVWSSPSIPLSTVKFLQRTWNEYGKPDVAGARSVIDLATAISPLRIETTTDHIRFMAGPATLTSALIQGTFPPYAKLIPDPACQAWRVAVLVEDLVRAVQSAADVANAGLGIIRLEWTPTELKVSAISEEAGAIETTIPCEATALTNNPPPGRVALNHSYLMCALRDRVGTVTLEIASAESPIAFSSNGVLSAIVMPMFAKWGNEETSKAEPTAPVPAT